MDKYHICSWSGGKDSTYLVDELLRLGKPLDEVIFCDTGHEFPIMYKYIKKIKKYWQSKYDIKITLLNWKNNGSIWDKWAETPFTKGQFKGQKRGFPFHMGMSWCTRELKLYPFQNYVAETQPNKEIITYVGIAYNEPNRIKENGEVYPLYDWWKITEDEIAKILVERGLHNPLYNHFHRTGCFDCPKQSLLSLYKIWKHYPKQWKNIKKRQKRYTKEKAGVYLFKDYTYKELVIKFKKYEDLGKPTHYLEEEQPIGCMCK
jgi:3'-phosphoadenosine 5'-phosphosulfate sulfotransferase (PAPS reductase)/FAD synthetase